MSRAAGESQDGLQPRELSEKTSACPEWLSVSHHVHQALGIKDLMPTGLGQTAAQCSAKLCSLENLS